MLNSTAGTVVIVTEETTQHSCMLVVEIESAGVRAESSSHVMCTDILFMESQCTQLQSLHTVMSK